MQASRRNWYLCADTRQRLVERGRTEAMRRTRQDLGFTALRVEGGILPAEFLQKVISLEAKGQSAKDYRLPKGTTIKDEIGRAWRIASAEWREYRENNQRQDVDRTKLGVDQWLFTLFKVVLGHDDIESCSVIRFGDRSFPITHKSVGGAVPLVLATENFRLDKTDARFGDEGRRRSPHGLMQEFLNASDQCLWGIISNGKTVQLLRDNPSLTKPAYIEADLERIFEEQLYSDFAALWLIFHGSRFVCTQGKPSECFMEEWRKEGHETGERALTDLRKGVTAALKELGNGFLQVKKNAALKSALESGRLSPDAYFRELLRLVYRLLFLHCVEDRDLLHPAGTSDEARLLYRKGYSVSRLRDCALLKRNYDKHFDMWEGLQIAFHGLHRGEQKLGLPALGGLFTDQHCPFLEESMIENQFLLRAIFELSFFRTGEVLARVNYRDMGTEELGSVYESLLELHPGIDVEKTPWTFEFIGEGNGAAGSERKLSGSYYTPASLVNELLRTAVDPVIENVKQSHPDSPRKALLSLKIVDPACGSGHFLLAAARRLAIEVARLDSTSELSEEAARRHALREVAQSCIYGVDKNELALELCKTSLWIEAVEPGRPLSFLDAHLRCGDSLVGILSPGVIEDGISDEAYSVLTGDDKATVSELKRKNKDDKYEHAVVQGSVFDQNSMAMLSASREAVDAMPEETIEQIEAKQAAFTQWLTDVEQSQEEVKCNLFVGAFFANKSKEAMPLVPRTEDLNRVKRGMAARSGVFEMCHKLSRQYKFFHWHLAFSEVFKNGGFDIVLGNPPWERIKLQEEEFFASRVPAIAEVGRKAERESMIKRLLEAPESASERMIAQEFTGSKRASESVSLFLRHSGRYPLCGKGDINTYTVFAETMKNLVKPTGFVGCVVPSGIATDDTTKEFFSSLVEGRQLVSLFDFENSEGLFRSVHREQKFCLLTMCGKNAQHTDESVFVFFAKRVEDLADKAKLVRLSPDDLRRLNPNTLNCPIFRASRDAEIAKKVYGQMPVLHAEREPAGNLWDIRPVRLFDMTNEESKFRTAKQLMSLGAVLKGNEFELSDKRYLPLYEGKLTQIYDHRATTFDGVDAANIKKGNPRELGPAEHRDPTVLSIPRYWLSLEDFTHKLSQQFGDSWLSKELPAYWLTFHDIANPNNARTFVATICGGVPMGNKIPVIAVGERSRAADTTAALAATFNSLAFDYISRMKIGSRTVNFFILKQLPVISPELWSSECAWSQGESLRDWILPRVLELSCTAVDVAGFAAACGFGDQLYEWNEQRREIIQSELDGCFFQLFGLNREDAEWVIDSFESLRRYEEKAHGEFRTRRLVLESFEKILDASVGNSVFKSSLDPEPGRMIESQVLGR